jgi:hypothetical protein
MIVLAWAKAFALTLVLELPIVFVGLRRFEASRVRLLALAAFANLATHPVAWFVFPELPIAPWTSFGLAECWACAAEALFFLAAFRGVSWRRAVMVALIANVTSLGIGLALYEGPLGWLLG